MTRSIDAFRSLTTAQRHVFVACFLGWTLDAFDFFLVTFVVAKIADDFKHTIVQVAFAITITLMFRPLGALIFGIFADRFGRRTPLMVNILLYSIVELLTAFSPNLTVFIVLRAIFGICMGGEWGIGAALTMESLPTRLRGVASGILQEGYAFGYLIAAIAYFLIFPHFGWRGMFIAGAFPALLVLYVRSQVQESPVWLAGKASSLSERGNLWGSFLKQPLLYVYAILLMAAFNFMSHGTQDLYPTFLQKQRELGVGGTTLITIIANVGAIIGGTLFGALSQRIGRRFGILLACLLGACTIPLWVFAPSTALLALGGFLIQFFVQGAWGIIPIHLNELSPGDVRGTFPGFTYQIGNLISAGAAQIEAAFAASKFKLPNGGADYAHALAVIAIVVFAAVFILTAVGHERRGIELTADA
ncbi:MAG: MFS transporter [Candidatus Baltobacteraceae bacterium]